jgi:hypothetical protein
LIWLLALASASLAEPPNIPVIMSRRTVGKTCVIGARDLSGPFQVVVTWAPCKEVRISVTSVAELADIRQFDGLECEDVTAIVRSNRGHVVSAWGEFTAAVYARESSGTRQIYISD